MERLETRSFELRLAGTGDEPVLVGLAAVFDAESEGLPIRERIRPGAFRKSLESDQDILALVNHDPGKVLGRRSNGTLSLREDSKGLFVEIRPNMETSFGRDVVASVKRGDLKGMSFGFVCRRDEWHNDRREILEADLREVSIVSMPAYPQTTIQKRNQEVGDMNQQERELRQKLADLKAKHEKLLTRDNLSEQEQQEQLELAKEIRGLEAELAAHKPAPEPAPVVLTPGVDEQRAAFENYLRGLPYDTRAMATGTDTAGGFLAPDGFLNEVIRALTEASVMRRLARTIAITAGSVKIPRLDGSVTAAWTAEAAAIAPSDPTFGQLEFIPHKLAAMTLVSNELLADSGVNVEQLLAGLFGEKLAEVEEAAYWTGNGAGQPAGLLSDASIERVETASSTAIAADDLIKLYDALPAPYRANATWVMHPQTMNALRQLKDANGRYLLVDGLAAGAPQNILGRPVMLSSNIPTISAGADVIVFGDLARCYYIVDRQGLEVQRSVDRYFEQDLTAFRAIKRTTGGVVLPEACRILRMAAV